MARPAPAARTFVPSPELREAALARAQLDPDRRVRDVLDAALLAVAKRAEAWVSSHGTIDAVDVSVLVDGRTLARLDASPALRDAVLAVVAGAAPSALDATVTELVVAWGVGEAHAEGYRDHGPRPAHDDDDALRAALAAYLHEAGDEASARALARATLVREGDVVRVAAVPPDAVAPALRALLGRAVRVVGRD